MFERLLPALDRPVYTAAIVAVGFGLMIWLFDAFEASETKDWPTERATISKVKVHGGFFPGCGKGGGPEVDITWRSLDPPGDLPETFLDKDQCLDAEVGETFTIVRVIDPDGHVETYINPVRTYAEAREEGMIALALAFPVVLIVLFIRLWWIGRRKRGYFRW